MRGEGCRLSMALARPWIWQGFTEEGEIVDEASALQSFVIPVFH